MRFARKKTRKPTKATPTRSAPGAVKVCGACGKIHQHPGAAPWPDNCSACGKALKAA